MASISMNRDVFWSIAGRAWQSVPWRAIFTRLPLPMLALAASYGVYRFSSFFVPMWVAVIQAAAFEATYLGLSATRDLTEDGRRRARWISVGAVVVSIIYNSLAGLFDRNPEWITDMAIWAEWTLAIMHGLPLALVAYLVADLLLHGNNSMSEILTATVAGLRKDIADAQQVIADLRSAVAGKDQELATLSQQFAASQRYAASQRQNVAAAGQTFADQQRAIADQAAKLAAQAQQLAALRAELDSISQIGGVDVINLAAAAKRGGATWDNLAAWTGIKVGTLRSKLNQ